jgi:hypothetical protein
VWWVGVRGVVWCGVVWCGWGGMGWSRVEWGGMGWSRVGSGEGVMTARAGVWCTGASSGVGRFGPGRAGPGFRLSGCVWGAGAAGG